MLFSKLWIGGHCVLDCDGRKKSFLQWHIALSEMWYMSIFVLVPVSYMNSLILLISSNITIHIHIHVLPSYHTSYRTCHVNAWLFHNQCFTYIALWGKSELEGFVMVIFIDSL